MPVIGAVQRGGKIVVKAVDNVKRTTVLPFVTEQVAEGSAFQTDEYAVYNTLTKHGYGHERVQHKEREYVRYQDGEASVHTNTVGGFWSYPKSTILRIHRGVSRQRLQGYLNEHTFRYNRRNDAETLFVTFLNRLSLPQPTARRPG